MAIQTLVSSIGNEPHATGLAKQAHVVYAANSSKWLHFYFTSTATLQCDYSSDFATWSSAGSLTLANNHNSEGRSLTVAYLNQSSTDTIHICTSYKISSTSRKCYRIRATFSGTSITFGTETQLWNSGTLSDANATWDGTVIGFDSNNKVYFRGGYADGASPMNLMIEQFATADNSGASWTPGTETDTLIESEPGEESASALFSLGSGNMLVCGDDGGGTFPNSTDVRSSKWNGSSWGAAASALASTNTMDSNDWGMAAVSTSDIHLVLRTGTNTYTHRRFNGTSWSAGNSITNQTSKAAAGLGMIYDPTGAKLYLWIIDSAAGNAIRYCTWVSGTGWSAWTAFETTSATRTNLSLCPQIGNSTISVIWTDGSANPFAVKGEQLSLAVAGPPPSSTLALLGVG